MFIPRGWWHCVLNTGDVATIAVTQNYAAKSSLFNVRKFLKQYNNCVSGIGHEYRSKLWAEFDRVLSIAGLVDVGVENFESIDDDHESYADSCESGVDQAPCQISFWDHFGDRQLTFNRS
jgi:hypothetical protein